ncbi:hypothetical protein PRIPAC_70382 [Pristionchus pacificus]|uniref:G protein-coupled receptor n=1 Tax=Pristionchus pacificus TaxID=54126 RepID=A0A2A6C000_PRIPA|nr:hypothetical protein PRIPAC_70382 [Pristionchus pacificus]|eukprot:PDM71460.1 G protein-coupled receptor [Pristionchus pacificus]
MRMQAVEPNKFRAIGIPDTLLICISWEIIRENSYNILNCSKVKEVLDFSVAILPSVILSVIMHTLSLVPSILYINDLLGYPTTCLIYFSVHSLNCILTKLTLIACHKGMRNRLLAIWPNHSRALTIQGIIAEMASAGDYLFLSIETLINTLSLIVMIPCMITLVRTQGMHANCRVLLITSGTVQTLLLLVQCALFIYDYAIENLVHDGSKDLLFNLAQNGLFCMTSYLYLVLVLERSYAVRNALQYEQSGHHIVPLVILICGSVIFACAMVYAIYFLSLSFEMIFVVYGIEGITFIISIIIIVSAQDKLKNMPYDEDRLKAKYQVKEVLRFSMAILPSIILSVFMHTLSLAPTMLFKTGQISWPLCCVIYFSVHSLNCIVTKFTLIACHKGMRQRFQLIFIARISTPKGARKARDFEKEGKEYFNQMKAAGILPLNPFFTPCNMAPAASYLFISIETLINALSMVVMIPCMITLVRTQGMHGNCKIILLTSFTVQCLLLIDQCALFVYDYTIENLVHYGAKEKPFHIVQNALFATSTYVSLTLVLERTFAVWHAAQYETKRHHLIPLCLLLSGSLPFSALIVYCNYVIKISDVMIFVFYGVEGFTFAVHSLNCIVTKAALIAFHPGMRARFKLIFVARIKF